ncbi:hypothetical protein [Thalassobaculum sp.]|uniref:hypothetical protein n=1 Tax=Thalassobaculum sp. TaxID=2022740 RepID=UPI003B5B1318
MAPIFLVEDARDWILAHMFAQGVLADREVFSLSVLMEESHRRMPLAIAKIAIKWLWETGYIESKFREKRVKTTHNFFGSSNTDEYKDNPYLDFEKLTLNSQGVNEAQSIFKSKPKITHLVAGSDKITFFDKDDPDQGADSESQIDSAIVKMAEGPADDATINMVDALVEDLKKDNEYRFQHPEDVEIEIARIELGRKLLAGPKIDLYLVEKILIETIKEVVRKAADTALGRLADNVLNVLVILVANAQTL